MKAHPLRLKPGQDLKVELDTLARQEKWDAACILTCAGSLTRAVIRYADRKDTNTLTGHFEIVSLTGTISQHGSHLHLSVSDSDGRTIGGHLKEGSLIYTTAEIVVGILPDFQFLRKADPATGFPELSIEPK